MKFQYNDKRARDYTQKTDDEYFLGGAFTE